MRAGPCGLCLISLFRAAGSVFGGIRPWRGGYGRRRILRRRAGSVAQGDHDHRRRGAGRHRRRALLVLRPGGIAQARADRNHACRRPMSACSPRLRLPPRRRGPMRASQYALAAGGLALTLALAISQARASATGCGRPVGPGGQLGVGWLERATTPIPSTFWANTTGDVLAPIFASLSRRISSPAGRAALRRVVLSERKAPRTGDDALFPNACA